MSHSIAVLTGDLVGSSRSGAAATDIAMAALAEAAALIDAAWHLPQPTRFTRFRGDGWHMAITDPGRSLRAALYLTATLLAANTGLHSRIAIGCGPVETYGSGTLADAQGMAFQQSGRGLDAMKRGRTMTITGDMVSPLHKAVIALADDRAQRWTREQAEAVALALTYPEETQADRAARLGISTQAMSLRLGGAGYPAFRDVLELWETGGHRP